MEQPFDNEKPLHKIYKNHAIWVGTFLGGPLTAGYLIAQNFKVFNETGKVWKTWIIAILATIIIFSGVFLIPENIKIPNQIIPLIYTSIAYLFVRRFQEQKIAAHINAGGPLYGWWRTIAISILGSIITLTPIFGIFLISEGLSNNTISTKTYGLMKHEISYDPNNISESEIDKIADGFVKAAFFNPIEKKYVYAKKTNRTYELSIAVIPEIIKDSMVIQQVTDLRVNLQSLFSENKIEIKLVDYETNNLLKTFD